MWESLLDKRKLLSLAEGFFLLSYVAYLFYEAIRSTTFGIQFSDTLETDLLNMLGISVVVKSVVLLWADSANWKHWLGLLASAVVVALVYHQVYLSDEYMFLEFLALLTVGMLGSDYHKVAKLHVCVVGFVFAAAILASLSGIIPKLVYPQSGVIRSAWGIGFPTDYASYFVYLAIIAWVAWKRIPDWIFALFGGVSLLNALYIARSRTSAICSILFVLVILATYIARRAVTKSKERNGGVASGKLQTAKSIVSWLVSLAFPLFCVAELGLMVLYAKGFSVAQRIDVIFSGRLQLGWDAYKEHGLSWFGTPFEQIGGGGSTFQRSDYNFVDSSYPLILLRYGIVLLVIIAVLSVLMSRKAIKLGDWRLALGLAIIAFHSLSEHHFIELNYNAFLVFPFAVLGIGWKSGEKKSCEVTEESLAEPTIAKRELVSGSIAAVTVLGLLALLGPMVLSWVKTAWEVTGTIEIDEKLARVFLLIVGALVLLILMAVAFYRVVHALIGHHAPKRSDIVMIVAGAVVVIVAGVYCNRLIVRHQDAFMDTMNADRAAIEAVQKANASTGGRLYSDAVPELYQRKYGGFSASFFMGDDLARCEDTTVIMDADYDSACLLGRGFLYTQISDEHAVYTNDEAAIAELEDAGFYLTGYYSKKRDVDLKSMAELNRRPMTDDGAIMLQGEGAYKSLIFGPGLELRAGDYTITFDLSIPEDDYDPSASEDYELGYLRVSTDWGTNVVKKAPLMRSQFGSEGVYVPEVECALPDSRGVELLVFLNGEQLMSVKEISYQKTPEYDTHVILNERNQKTCESYYDLEGNPLEMSEGYYARLLAYDSLGNVSAITFLDVDGKPTITSQGYARITYKYDSNNLVVQQSYYDENNKPILVPSNYSSIRKGYDSNKHVIREEYFGLDGLPITIKGGYAALEREYDSVGNISIERYYDTVGKPVNKTNGYAEVHRDFDESGHVVREEYYGADGNPIRLDSGLASIEYKYDTYGNRTDIYYYDEQGMPTLLWNAYASVHDVFNDQAQIVCEWYYDLSGNIMTLSEGYAMVEYVYDEKGNAIVLGFNDTESNLVMRTDGFAQIRRAFDVQHRCIRDEYFDSQGAPCDHAEGYHAVEYSYDSAGNIVERRFYDQHGNLVNSSDGYAIIVKEYDGTGAVIKTTHYDSNMQLVESK